jgi:hypothetical protein
MATSYTKTNWQDVPSTATPITAAQLNRMEKGIEDCNGQGNANELAIAANAEAIQTLKSGIQLGSISITQLLLMAHPIGSIYSSTATTSPADLFGGTWERIKGAFIWGIDDGETAGTTGGEKAHTLTVNEIPAHAHTENGAVMVWNTKIGNVGAVPARKEMASATLVSPALNTGSTGGGQSHNNMPPYYGAYVWRRTA